MLNTRVYGHCCLPRRNTSVIRVSSIVLGILLILFVFPTSALAQTNKVLIDDIGTTYCYNELQGALRERFSYFFSISPDENWIATFNHGGENDPNDPHTHFRRFYTFRLLNQSTKRVWSQQFLESTMPEADWFPNCFSQNSDQLFFGKMTARLSPTMASLEFKENPGPLRMDRFDGDFSGFPKKLKSRQGKLLKTWFELGEYDQGRFVWDYNSNVLYESLREPIEKESTLRVSSEGAVYHVNYDRIRSVMHPEKFLTKEKLVGAEEAVPRSNRSHVQSVLQSLDQSLKDAEKREGPPSIELNMLTLSPDGKFIAAIANFVQQQWTGNNYPLYGVLIPLDRGGLAAFPFAENISGKAIWSKNSRRIYFHHMPKGGKDINTVCYIDINSSAIPPNIPKTVVAP